MKFLKYIISTSILLAGLNASADKKFCKGDDDKHFSFKKMKKELNLTSEQLSQLKSSKKEMKTQLKEKKQAMRAAKKDLELALKSNTSEDQIRTKYAELQKLQEDFSKSRFEMILKVRSVLTAEQKAKFKTAFGDK